jgi:transcriptional regulator of nitric oxide reductase
VRILTALIAAVAAGMLAIAAGFAAERDTVMLSRVFPGADGFGRVSGTPPAIPALKGGTMLGWVLHTSDVIGSVGFSGKKLDIAVGIDRSGRITGAELVAHQEPILAIGVTDAALRAFIAQYRGVDIRNRLRLDHGRKAEGVVGLDAVSGATVSSLVMNDAVIRSARAVARSRGILGDTGASLDLDSFAPSDWAGMLESGAIARFDITNGAADAALRAVGASGVGPPGVPRTPQDRFIELFSGLATPAAIGRNLFGQRIHDRLTARLAAGEQVLFLGARGYYSAFGRAWRRTGLFDRIQIIQGEHTIRLTREGFHRLEQLAAAGAPDLREKAFFVLPASTGFDPVRPFRIDLLVPGEAPGGRVFARFALDYRVPSALVRPAGVPAGMTPLWVEAWLAQADDIAVLVTMLVMLSLILVFQDTIVQRQRFYKRLRFAFLAVTLVWLGWYAGAQLSVVNVLTFVQALVSGFRWEVFLVAPLIFILWSYVAVTLLFWGRGVLCGWLCPFGALQELASMAARRLGLRQITVPFRLHERLWPIKYVIFLMLFALSLGGLDQVQWAVEVEPFKTAVVLRFLREWPFVLYAVILIAVGLVVERAFCRYLCPLGAALAIPARMRMFEWLKRKRQCGTSCQACAERCPVQSIHPEGHINPNECIYCLNCQMLYHDDHICPPLIGRRLRREARQRRLRMQAPGGGAINVPDDEDD